MRAPLLERSPLENAVASLRRDLVAEGGPSISAMRNYRFAILVYPPTQEFDLRRHIRRLSDELRADSWNVLSISLQSLLLNRVRSQGDQFIRSVIERERRTSPKSPGRALAYATDQVSRLLEEPEGLAGEVVTRIDRFAEENQLDPERTVIFIGRAGALYPFHRSSALLKHVDGRTRGLPVILLYPGQRGEGSALSFMGRLPADRDYRPRIYSS